SLRHPVALRWLQEACSKNHRKPVVFYDLLKKD
uniref:Uncharacterized protein n=1 Tax=Aegilops tauschii subsp. strangulata TaxID=200361 RepID=A0A452ZZI8_AEGTS